MGNSLNLCDVSADKVMMATVNVIEYDKGNLSTDDERAQRKNDQVKLRPILLEFENLFNEHADKNGMIGKEQLMSIWYYYAHSRHAEISEEDEDIIKFSINGYLKEFDFNEHGQINVSTFMTFMLGGTEDRIVYGNLRKEIREALARDHTALHKVYDAFKNINQRGDGMVDKEQLVEATVKMQNCSKKAAEAEAEKLMDEMDLDRTGSIDYYEFLSYALGRRSNHVELLVYDVSSPAVSRFGGILFGHDFSGIFHTSIVCYGYEFWYGGMLFQNKPPMDKFFGMPLNSNEIVQGFTTSHYEILRKKGILSIPLGKTLVTHEELLKFVKKNMWPKYNEDSYDILTCNCNCYSNDLAHFLTGHSIPQPIIDLPKLATGSFAFKMFKPVLNQWLGGFGKDESEKRQCSMNDRKNSSTADAVRDHHQSKLSQAVEAELDDIADRLLHNKDSKDHLGQAAIMVIPAKLVPEKEEAVRLGTEPVLAQVKKVTENGSDVTMDLRWFSPQHGFVLQEGIPKATVTLAMVESNQDAETIKKTKRQLAALAAAHDSEHASEADRKAFVDQVKRAQAEK